MKLCGLGIKSKIAAALSDGDVDKALTRSVVAFRLLKIQRICRAKWRLAKRGVDFSFPLPLAVLYCTERAWQSVRVKG